MNARIDTGATTGRFDLYGPAHKGLRHANAEMLGRLGRADFSIDQGALLADLRQHLAMNNLHLIDEDKYIHPAIEARAPGASATLARQHAEHRASFAMLEEAIRAVERAQDGRAVAAGRSLYLAFSGFVAEDLQHMLEEEEQTWPLLCTLFTDDELMAIEQSIASSLDPDALMYFLGHLAPAMNPAERATLLGGVKTAVPPDVYAAIMENAVRPVLNPADIRQLAQLGLLP
ncbi:hemerythrin domain-containing protein [Hyalangium versicolor]|uniref:hemerythrin domain-containing protein n=1 Tax=Hyalangium versicolor TaxID=2861190 RepID=UPI001CC9869F|nr:hemerythrin domain-containing protein [Hyalangium versicolor]